MHDPCESYLMKMHDCESYVECVLRSKGFKIIARDQHGYDIEAYYPSGMYYYFIEVKCGPGAKLSSYQRRFKLGVEIAREVGFNITTDKGLELIPKFVLCQFDHKYRLIADQSCKKLLR
uniref:Uncharacterized protein n=2 Tax=Saccharolobus islandicus TaxID=43080 RepID=Q0ZNP6_SACIS|nr:hypothetical protein [Sulfolobus islandicus]